MLLVFVPILWMYIGSLFVELTASDTIEKLTKNAAILPDATWRLRLARRVIWVPVFVFLDCYPSTASLYLLIQVEWGMAPHRILWQVIAAAGYSISSIIPPAECAPEYEETTGERDHRRGTNRLEYLLRAIGGTRRALQVARARHDADSIAILVEEILEIPEPAGGSHPGLRVRYRDHRGAHARTTVIHLDSPTRAGPPRLESGSTGAYLAGPPAPVGGSSP